MKAMPRLRVTAYQSYMLKDKRGTLALRKRACHFGEIFKQGTILPLADKAACTVENSKVSTGLVIVESQ